MIGREKRMLLRHYLERGMSKAAIARHLGISRRTVYNWIEADRLPELVREQLRVHGAAVDVPERDPAAPAGSGAPR